MSTGDELQELLAADAVENEIPDEYLPGIYTAIEPSSGFQGKTYWDEGAIAYVGDDEVGDSALVHFAYQGPLPKVAKPKAVFDPEVHLAQATFAEAEALKSKVGINAPPKQSKISPPKK